MAELLVLISHFLNSLGEFLFLGRVHILIILVRMEPQQNITRNLQNSRKKSSEKRIQNHQSFGSFASCDFFNRNITQKA